MTTVVPSPKIMNIEHTWPQSEGANGDAKSDLHHLYITDSATNSMRSSLPFCDVVTLKWTNGESKRGYNKSNIHCFEPPQSHKGNVARSIFYFSIRYNHELDQEQEACLRAWDKIDPVTEDEILRTKLIESYQGNLNPFITDPTLIDKIPKF
jgi:endonuclease I